MKNCLGKQRQKSELLHGSAVNVNTDYFSDQKYTILGRQGMEKVIR